MKSIIILQILFFFVFFLQAECQGPVFLRRNQMAPLEPLTCTPACNELRALKDTPDVVCSCSSSCLSYGDCCRDAPFKNNGDERKQLGCLTLSGLGPVSIVKSCPTSSSVLSDACAKGFGTSAPVTSTDTGTTYSNFFCALCNADSFNLVEWPVELRCCLQDRKIRSQTVSESIEYDHARDIMWSISELRNGSKVYCECKFYAQNNDLSFARNLELRECKRTETSTCLSSWTDKDTEKMCNAYLDPLYIGNNAYRNRHCATCNFQHIHRMRCAEDPLDTLLMSPPRILAFCKARGIANCTSFLRAKGHPISFSQLFAMKEVQCIPPEDRRCCAGERYDRYLKTCRKIPTRVVV